MEYIAFIYKTQNGYAAFIPDLKGLPLSYGKTFEETVHNIRNSAEVFCENLPNVPKSSSLENLLKANNNSSSSNSFLTNVSNKVEELLSIRNNKDEPMIPQLISMRNRKKREGVVNKLLHTSTADVFDALPKKLNSFKSFIKNYKNPR